MSVLFLHTTPPPLFDNTDAVHQEVGVLEKMIEGEVVFLNPWKTPNRIFPRPLVGWHLLPKLKELELKTQLNHLFSPILYHYPILNRLKNPIIYNLSAGLNRERIPTSRAKLAGLEKIIISNDRDQHILKELGLTNYKLIRTGIDTSHIHPHSLPLCDEFKVLMASSPWVREQFHSKGIELLLKVVRDLAPIRLILLWRGFFEKEIHSRIHSMGLNERVQVINKPVNIQDYLSQVHATILLARTTDIVKAYPHSLIESLAAGKPIITSEPLAMADYIRETNCGIVLENWDENELTNLFIKMKSEYTFYKEACLQNLAKDFSQEDMITKFKEIYAQIISN